MQTARRFERGFIYVAVVVVVVLGAQLLVGAELGTSPVYVVVSRSMVPTLEVGDLVIAQTVPYSDIQVGDVIIYVQPSPSGGCAGLTIVHRVVAITSSGLITQGDDRITNPQPDEPTEWPPVQADCLKGEVILAIPYLGLISMTIHYPYNYVLVALILLFVFLSEIRPVRSDGEKPASEKGGNEGGEGGEGPPKDEENRGPAQSAS